MKVIKRIIFILILAVLFMPFKANAVNNVVNMYLFYRSDCPHCAALEEYLEKEIIPNYSNLKIYKYDVLTSSESRELMNKAEEALGETVTSVPYTVIGTKSFVGYSETLMTGPAIKEVIDTYSKVASYKDPVGEAINVVDKSGTLTYDDIVNAGDNGNDNGNNSKNEEEYIIDIPFIGAVSTKTLSLPIVSIVIGAIDGFNPCAMWVLIFLISTLIGMKDRKKMFIIGITFLLTSAIIYLFFMLMWISVVNFIGTVWWLKLIIGLIALAGGYLNVRAFIKTKDTGCEIVDEQKRKKVFNKIKAFTKEKSFILALLGVVTLAISVNFIELTCSAGLPAIFANILAMNELSTLEYALYMFLYILFFLIDDLIVFIIAMTTLKLTGVSNKYSKYSHLIGGILMLIIGLLMLFKPEWLMFNF